MRSRLKILMILPVLVMLQGCTAALLELDAASLQIFQKQDINLEEKSFAAADYLAHQMLSYVRKTDRLKATPMLNQDEPALSAPIGHILSRQMGTRFSQIGYNVDLDDVLLEEEVSHRGAYQDKSQRQKPHFILGGTYQQIGQNLNINIRMTDLADSRIIATFKYSMPISREIAKLSLPKPLIFRVSE